MIGELSNANFFSPRDRNADRGLDAVWEKFLGADDQEHFAAGGSIRSFVLSSWKRCLSGGVDPLIMAAPIFATENELVLLQERNRELCECSHDVVGQGSEFLKDLGAVLFLTDPAGVNLKIVGDQNTLYEAQCINLIPGSAWGEVVSGSNAVGTALATKSPVQVHGEEHYCKGFKPWTCTATVIRDPYDQEVLGVIDLSGLRDIFNNFHLPLVVSLAGQIEARLARRSLERRHKLEQHVAAGASDRSCDGILLFDGSGRMMKAGKNIAPILAAQGVNFHPSKTMRLSFSNFGGTKPRSESAPSDWIRPEWVEPIKDGNDTIGFKVCVPPTMARGPVSARPLPPEDPFAAIIGNSPSIRQTVEKSRRIADAPIPVLLLGETGVGKEVFARSIHDAGASKNGAFIDLNCGGLSRDILASELFGHVEGAFTGSRKGGMIGKIEAAEGGTLFLDEIGDMPMEMQPMLLRVLQERQVYRVGDVKPRRVNFRLIAATNRDLSQAVREGKFRQDLFFRISTMLIDIIPLRDRIEDIPVLARHFFEKMTQKYAIIPKRMDEELLDLLMHRPWPGNVRELSNVIELMCFMSKDEMLTKDDLPFDYMTSECQSAAPQNAMGSLELTESEAIRQAVQSCSGNLTATARQLKIAKSTLYLKLKKYNININ
jgi:transcriptional regulator of acetoin/glycerol metabolism